MTYKECVDLIGEDRHLVPAGHLQDVTDVLFGEDRAARIGRAVDHDARRVVVDLRLQVLQVHLPRLLRLLRRKQNVNNDQVYHRLS